MNHIYQTVSASTITASTEISSCIISTINADREGDRVIPEGGDFSNYMKSPVLLWAHGGTDGYSAVPIGSVTALEVQPGQGVWAEWKWLENDAFATRIKNAWQQGVIRASSIGFKPLVSTKNGVGSDIEKWEMLELSLCAIPMNPEAVRSLKALGLMNVEVLELRMTDETKAVPEEVPSSTGPQPTPSVPPPPVMVTEPDDAAKIIAVDEPMTIIETTDVDTPAVASIEAIMSIAVVGVIQGVLAQMHPVIAATESIIGLISPEMLADKNTQDEISQSLCALMDQLHSLIEVVYSAAHAIDDDDTADNDYGEYEMTDAMGSDKPKPSYMMSMKSGRVLSYKNESKIKAAQVHLNDVMKSLYKEMPVDNAPAKSYVLMDEAEEPSYSIDDTASEQRYEIDVAMIRSIVSDVIASSITKPAMQTFERAVNVARGRVH